MANSDPTVERAYRRIAEDYARKGYRVTRSDASRQLPDFLRDYHPDLVAERPGDHVVVEVKRTRSLRGSNDLVELAERITPHPGWRLELVALGKDLDEIMEVLEPDWLEKAARLPDHLAADPTVQTYFAIYMTELLECLLRALGHFGRLRTSGKSAARIAQDLTFRGVIDQETLSRVEQSMAWRNDVMHGLTPRHSAEQESDELRELCAELHERVRREAIVEQDA